MSDTPNSDEPVGLTPEERSDRRQESDDRASDNADRREVSDVRASDNADRRQVSDVAAGVKADRREKSDQRRAKSDRRGLWMGGSILAASLVVIAIGWQAQESDDKQFEKLENTDKQAEVNTQRIDKLVAQVGLLTEKLRISECNQAYQWLGIVEQSKIREPGEPPRTEQQKQQARDFAADQMQIIEDLNCVPPTAETEAP